MRAKPESTIISWKLRASNLESKIKHEIFNKRIDFLTIFKKEISRKMIVSLLVGGAKTTSSALHSSIFTTIRNVGISLNTIKFSFPCFEA